MTPQIPLTLGSAASLDTVNRAAAAQSKAYEVYFAAQFDLAGLTWSARDEARDVYYAAARSLDAAKEAYRDALAAYRAELDSASAKGGLA